jgi:ABC-type polysaccharide/polyol phosphate export permease
MKQLIKSDLKIKYKGSVLGVLWSLLEPLSKFIIMFFVFSFIFNRFNDPLYSIYLFSGIIVWGYFSSSSQTSVRRILSNGNLIKKANFPREILVISGVISSTIFFLIELIPVIILMIYLQIMPGLHTLLFIPFLLVFTTLNLGIGFFLSSTNVFMRDIQYIWNVVLKAGFYATPVLYELSKFPESGKIIITLNPVTGLLNFFRGAVIQGTIFPITSFGYSILFSILILVIGYLTFRHYKGRFAEEL